MLSFFTFLILYNNLVPISLYVSLDMIKVPFLGSPLTAVACEPIWWSPAGLTPVPTLMANVLLPPSVCSPACLSAVSLECRRCLKQSEWKKTKRCCT